MLYWSISHTPSAFTFSMDWPKLKRWQFLFTVHDTIASQVYDSMDGTEPGYLFVMLLDKESPVGPALATNYSWVHWLPQGSDMRSVYVLWSGKLEIKKFFSQVIFYKMSLKLHWIGWRECQLQSKMIQDKAWCCQTINHNLSQLLTKIAGE